MNSQFILHHSPFRCAQWLVFPTLVVSAHLHAAPPNYDDHIRPIFEQSCNNCHNPDKQKGDLDLSTYSSAMRGGSGGKFAEPGDGASSTLYGVITHTQEPKMPEKGDKMAKAESDLIRSWIDTGMLENKTGKPKKKSKPAFNLKVAPSTGKPDGPPAMPQHLLLEPVVTPSQSTVVTDMTTSPWAPLLAIAGQRQVLLYHSDTLDLAAVLPFDQGQPEVLSFHPSGKYLLAGGGIAGKSGTTVTWEVETGKIILLAGKDYDSVLAASLRADLGGVSLGGPGKRVKLWDTGADELVASIKKHTDWITQLAYSPDGVLLASGGRGGGVYVWEADTGNEFHNLRAHKACITGLAWRSDSNLLATASEDGDVIVWSMSQGKQVKKWQAHAGGVLDLDWTRAGQLVTSGRDKKVKIWKADFGLAKELPAFPVMVVDVAFSHDGKRLFCADWAGAITAWDVASAKQIGTLQANPPTVARQIELIREKMASLPTQIKQADQALNKAKAELMANKNKAKKQESDHKNNVAQQKKLTTERGQLDAKLKKLNTELKATRSTLTKSEQTLKSAQSHRDNLHQQTAIQQNRLKRWQAAAINTDALRLNKEALALQHQQDEIMDAFTILAAELGKIKDPTDLNKKSHELNQLRNSIDQAAPQLCLKKEQAKERKAEYEKELQE